MNAEYNVTRGITVGDPQTSNIFLFLVLSLVVNATND